MRRQGNIFRGYSQMVGLTREVEREQKLKKDHYIPIRPSSNKKEAYEKNKIHFIFIFNKQA